MKLRELSRKIFSLDFEDVIVETKYHMGEYVHETQFRGNDPSSISKRGVETLAKRNMSFLEDRLSSGGVPLQGFKRRYKYVKVSLFSYAHLTIIGEGEEEIN